MKEDSIQIHCKKNYLFLIENKEVEPYYKCGFDFDGTIRHYVEKPISIELSRARKRTVKVSPVNVRGGQGRHFDLLSLNSNRSHTTKSTEILRLHSGKTYELFKVEEQQLQNRGSSLSMHDSDYSETMSDFNVENDIDATEFANQIQNDNVTMGQSESIPLSKEGPENEMPYWHQNDIGNNDQLVDCLDFPCSDIDATEFANQNDNVTMGQSESIPLSKEGPENEMAYGHQNDIGNNDQLVDSLDFPYSDELNFLELEQKSTKQSNSGHFIKKTFIEKNKGNVNSRKCKVNGSYARQFSIRIDQKNTHQLKENKTKNTLEMKNKQDHDMDNIESDALVDPLDAETSQALQELQKVDELLNTRLQNSNYLNTDNDSPAISAHFVENSFNEIRNGKHQLPPIREPNATVMQSVYFNHGSLLDLNDLSTLIQSEKKIIHEEYASPRSVIDNDFIDSHVQPNVISTVHGHNRLSLAQESKFSRHELGFHNAEIKEKQNNYSAQYFTKVSTTSNDPSNNRENGYAVKHSGNVKQQSYKPYTLKEFKTLDKSIKLQRSLGPDFQSDTYVKKKVRASRQKDYAETVRQFQKPQKPKVAPSTQKQNKTKDSKRILALNYAKNVPKPISETRKTSINSTSSGQNKTTLENLQDFSVLEVMKKRHEEEMLAVEALRRDLAMKIKEIK